MFKKIGKFIKRGLKKVGKFIKRGFKSIGKFVGKLGPVGMLGMMLIMPQLGAWWADFGTWAKELTGPLKGLMKGIHKAGEFVGTAASSVTEGISSLVKSIPGVGDAYQGFETWAQEQMDSARGFLGLETTTPVTDLATPPEGVSSDFEYSTGEKTWREGAGDAARQQGATSESIDIPGSSERSLLSSQQDVRLQKISTQTTDSQLFGGAGTPSFESLDDVKSFMTHAETSGVEFTRGELDVLQNEYTRLAPTTSRFDRFVDKASDIYGGYESTKGVLQEFGIGVEEPELSYPSYVADNYVPMYESAQVDWTQQGFAGTPPIGTGSPDYLQSIYASFQNDPYYQWMAQQRRA